MHFYAGHLVSGTQVLMGVQFPDFVMVEFNADGDYLKTSVRKASIESKNIFDIPLTNEDEEFLTEFRGWQTELGFIAGTISVKQFFLSDRSIGIKDLPDHYQEVLDFPDNIDAKRLKELQQDIRLWRESGDFVLYWDEEYYLDQDGELESS